MPAPAVPAGAAAPNAVRPAAGHCIFSGVRGTGPDGGSAATGAASVGCRATLVANQQSAVWPSSAVVRCLPLFAVGCSWSCYVQCGLPWAVDFR